MAALPHNLPDFDFKVDFPTLGFLAIDWIESHIVHPDFGVQQVPFELYTWQAYCTCEHYRIKPDAAPSMGSFAFQYASSLIVTPQKTGKGPWSAAVTAFEALGPCQFIGFAEAGDRYRCADFNCACGWEYPYEPGEPMGVPRPRALIQLLAYSEKQVGNIFRPLKGMLQYGHFDSAQLRVGEDQVRTPGDGLIQVVTSKAKSRLGAPLHFACFDEPQLYTEENGMIETADTVSRGLAGMDGRSLSTTNPWDSATPSLAQIMWDDDSPDIFKFWREPPEEWSYTNQRDRAKIHKYVYAGSDHVNLDAIERDAQKLIRRGDPGQAERFFGNRVVAGARAWMPIEAWRNRAAPREVASRTQVVLGFDGSDRDDWTGIRAETQDGYQFTPITDSGPTIWNPREHDGQVPRLEVSAAVKWLFKHFDVIRMYADPPYWESEVDGWAAEFGEKRVIRWATYRPLQMHAAAERLLTDATKVDSDLTHDGCAHTEAHVGATRTFQRPAARFYKLTKPGDGRKIDLAVCSILAHEAAGDATAAKLWRRKHYAYSA
jgi:hypothetical protein